MVSSTLKKMYFWVFLTYHTLFVRIMGATLEGLKVLACATAQHTQSLSHWQMTKKHSLFFFGSQNTPCHSFLYTLFVSYNKSLKSFHDFWFFHMTLKHFYTNNWFYNWNVDFVIHYKLFLTKSTLFSQKKSKISWWSVIIFGHILTLKSIFLFDILVFSSLCDLSMINVQCLTWREEKMMDNIVFLEDIEMNCLEAFFHASSQKKRVACFWYAMFHFSFFSNTDSYCDSL